MPARHHKKAIALGLAILTIWLYWRVQVADFVNFDDYDYVVNNPHVRDGLSLKNILSAFTHPYSFNWHPLSWISHMTDCELFGLNPGAHHMNNLLLHIANTLLLFHLLHRMTRALWRSALVAALFAVHPLHVESVAWISERKDVLSTLFFMLTLLAYLRYTEKPAKGRYMVTFVSFALGLMAKPMLVTLPFVLLLLDFWPLSRRGKSLAGLVVEKIPLFLLSTASSILTLVIHMKGGSISSSIPFATRVGNALYSYALYLLRTFRPSGLSCFYLHPSDGLDFVDIGGSALFLLLVTLGGIACLRKAPYLLVGWLWFLGTLVPVIGLIQAGLQGMADRYTYIPLIGIFLMAVWGSTSLFDRWKVGPFPRVFAAVAVLLPLSLLSLRQVQTWRNSETLFQWEISVTKHKHIGYFHLGNAYELERRKEKAVQSYREAVRIEPQYREARYHLANALAKMEKFQEAKEHYLILLRQDPAHFKALNNVGFILLKEGKQEEALAIFRRALEINPDNPVTRRNVELLLQNMTVRRASDHPFSP